MPATTPEEPLTAVRPPSPHPPRTAGFPEPARGCTHTHLSPSATLQLLGRARGRPVARPPGVVPAAGRRGNPRDCKERAKQVGHAPSGAGVTSRGGGGVAGLLQSLRKLEVGSGATPAPVPPASRPAYGIRAPL